MKNKSRQAYHDNLRASQVEFMRRYKADHGCLDCGERDPVVLLFHHKDPRLKTKPIGQMTGSGWPSFLREVEKCEVLCANCHMRRHYTPGK